MDTDAQRAARSTSATDLPSRRFAGRRFDLVWSQEGYLWDAPSGTFHVRDCAAASDSAVVVALEEVQQAWREQSAEAVTVGVDSRFCLSCLIGPEDATVYVGPGESYPAHVSAMGDAARVVLGHLFGDGLSVIDPSRKIWTPENAEYLRSAIQDDPNEGPGSFMEKLELQLKNAPRDVVLLAAESIYLRSLPLMNLRPDTKLGYIETLLARLPDKPAVPELMRLCLNLPGIFHGGQGYNQQFWKQMIWMALFAKSWTTLSRQAQHEAREDPWRFRDMTDAVPYEQPSMRNTLRFLAFPFIFEHLISEKHKRALFDGLSGLAPDLQLSSDLDHDLYLLRKHLEEDADTRIDWFAEPWYSTWQKRTWEGTHAWAVQPRTEDAGATSKWLKEAAISYNASYLRSLEPGSDFVTVRDQVFDAYRHLDSARRLILAEEIHTFISRMEEGDAVAVRDGSAIWVGRISGEGNFDSDLHEIRREVTWNEEPVSTDALPEHVSSEIDESPGVVELPESLPYLQDMLEDDSTLREDVQTSDPTPNLTDIAHSGELRPAGPALADQLHMDEIWLDEMISVLGERRQIILYGPPGTGKTFLARAIARHVTNQEPEIVQFHPSYAYEDFFEGYRPSPTDSGGLGFDLKPGPLRRLAAKATNDPQRPYVLLIDEINRGNLAKIFGEMYFLLEYRDEHIRLQYSSGEKFRLPPNLYIIGTMNTADRSIAMVDTAIRRRFAFLEMHPDTTPVAGLLDRWLLAQGLSATRARLLEALNDELGEESRDQHIGPSYFMRTQAATEVGLERIWKYDLLPLLEEHFYGIHSPAEVAERFSYRQIRRQLLRGEGASEATDSVL